TRIPCGALGSSATAGRDVDGQDVDRVEAELAQSVRDLCGDPVRPVLEPVVDHGGTDEPARSTALEHGCGGQSRRVGPAGAGDDHDRSRLEVGARIAHGVAYG